MELKDKILQKLRGGLIVSCQPDESGLFASVNFIVEFAKASELGGAVGVRIEGYENIKAVKEKVNLPVIGLIKGKYQDGDVLITPDFNAVEKIIESGADIVAIDVTNRENRYEFFKKVREEFKNLILLADVSTYEEGVKSAELGADLVATTLSGYTSYTRNSFKRYEPDFKLVEQLVKVLNIPVIAEGRIWTVEQARRMFELGAYAVVVGSAITRPRLIVQRFVEAISNKNLE
ncbi:N-acetylmannosamine-6-phosphate 2-epimerase [Candidatus Chrysopegis kryptomonas]|uniref:Putative N-acetylmannosamine-6-phosphate 2-epimerase n=1 Tax=Candidatus Chryseopegocella kryptomonas TaxID=1633643 RepID=A0A0P1MYG6_9BACT|nr:N-acylglucosamine-6-phosphate 2-epimerase [Candidatus Chrysopegis kryptomonas]